MKLIKQMTAQLIAPECSAPGCHRAGDHHTMVKCSTCGHWYCEDHLAVTLDSAPPSVGNEPAARIAEVPTIKLLDASARGPTYFVGYCANCLQTAVARTTNDSRWLR